MAYRVMEHVRTTDFTTGSIPTHLIAFATPMFIGNLLQAAYNTVDSIWVGRFLGPRALASVSVGFPIIFGLIALVTGLTMAITTLVSQYYGARRPDMVSAAISNGLTLLTIMGIVMAAIGYLLRWPLLRALRAPDDIIEAAASYLGVYTLGFAPSFIYNVVSSILRGLGDSRSPLRFLTYATVMNIVLDPIMIFGLGPIPRMEVAGAAWATVISQVFAAALALAYMVGRLKIGTRLQDLARLDWNLTKLTVKIGLPAGAQQTLVSLGMMVIMSTVNQFGSVVVAGSGVGSRLEQFGHLPAFSVGLAVTALVGQNLGAGRQDRVSEVVKWGMLLTCSITGALTVVVQAFPTAVLSLFTKDPEVLAAGTVYLRWISLGFVPFAAMFALTGVLRGAGDTLPTFFITLGSLWLVRVPLVRVLARTALGVEGVWMAMASGPFVGLLLSYAYYRSGRWKQKAIVSRRPVVGSAADLVTTDDIQ